MKVTGFTIVRNAILYDYPIVESLSSLLPLVDELVVAVGNSCDVTREKVASIGSHKLRIIDTVWDDSIRTGGNILAQQTNLAMKACGEADWYIYLQADEVLHEQDTACIHTKMKQHLHHQTIEGLSFRYHHFRADYHIRDPLPYRRQVRIIRPGIGISSFGDACGFRLHGQKLRTAATGAWVYHYGYVKPPENMSAKMDYFTSLYDGLAVVPGNGAEVREYAWNLATCERFTGTHPAVMIDRIAGKNWETPDVELQPRWRNPQYYRGLVYKNTAHHPPLGQVGPIPGSQGSLIDMPTQPDRLYKDLQPEQMTLRDHLARDRTELANERTFLSYLRTALGLIAVGCTLLKFFPEDGVLKIFGIVSTVLGLAMAAFGIQRYLSVRRRLLKILAAPASSNMLADRGE